MKAIIKVICLIYLLALLFPLYSYAGPKEDYEFQEHCGKRAAEIFKIFSGSGMSQDKGEDRVSNYTCHYNKKLKKCFVLLTAITYPQDIEDKKSFGILTDKELWDINENKQYGEYSKFSKIRISTACEFLGKQCNSENEWNALLKPYMEE